MSQKNNDESTRDGMPIDVSIQLRDAGADAKTPPAVAYAFTSSGHYISQASVDDKGRATLKVPASKTMRELRIVAGPATEGDDPPSLSELTRRGARERFVRLADDGKAEPVHFQIPANLWRCWIRFCEVEGKLLKRVLTGGLPVDMPVCHAQVQIWEVEPIEILVPRLPDLEIEKLREVILNPHGGVVPVNPNPPDPAPFERFAAHATGLTLAEPVPTLDTRSATISTTPGNLRFVAQQAGSAELRQALIAHPNFSRLWICRLFPHFVSKTLVATVTTDRCGHFEAWILLSCFAHAPNLYFTASVNILFGLSIPIYQPLPVACHTWWNYRCGQEVTLYTQSPFAPTCTPCAPVDAPQNYVLFRAIGNVALSAIRGTSTALAGATNSGNIGLIAEGGGTGLDAPFGSAPGGLPLLPRVEFDGSLRDLNLARHYLISWRFGASGAFAPLTGQIDRHYNHFVGTDLVTSNYNLGPKIAGGKQLFEIPPSLPPEGDWAYPDPRYDLANAQFPSSDLPAPVAGGTHGKYQLKLELFDTGGNPVDINAAVIRYFVPTSVDPDGTVHTADAASLGLVSGNSFIMTVHIDNRATVGELGTPALDGNPADDCGVFRYASGVGGPAGVVTIPYTASHPDNFATYSYRLSRGAMPLVPPSASDAVSPATDPATVSLSAAALLTHPNGTLCNVAGFAEDLYVAATATNGWGRISQYDSSPSPRAFVLAPAA